jgi:sugar/nucleoside kinase (ribokinase family)
MKKIYDVLVAGELNVDVIFNRLNKFPEAGKEILAEEMTITLGSSSAIFASNLSVLGSKVTFIGTLARDNFGNQIMASLQSKRVHTNNIIYTDKLSTGATVVLNFPEERAIITYPGAMSLLSIQHISGKALGDSRHLHVSSIFLSTGLKKDILELFKKAKALGLTTSLDPQWDPAERWDIDFSSLLPYVDIFMPNDSELKALTGTEDIHEGIKILSAQANIIIVKCGKEGAYLWKGGELIHQPAFFNPKVVDSVGAGDSFAAGFIHVFLQKKPLVHCLEFAALTGAINTTRTGGTTAFETLAEVKSIAQSSFNYVL